MDRNEETSSRRRSTYEKLKGELVEELSEICRVPGVKACLLVEEPGSGKVETWPQNRDEVDRILQEYSQWAFHNNNNNDSSEIESLNQRTEGLKALRASVQAEIDRRATEELKNRDPMVHGESSTGGDRSKNKQ